MKEHKGLKVKEDRYLKARVLVRAYKINNWKNLCLDPNIIGAAFGRRIASGEITDDPALVIYVIRKIPTRFIPPSRLLPRRLYVGGDFVEMDVVETGPIYPLAFTARERPAPAGVSIGHPNITAGTLGSVVIDNTDKSTCILSNNHVMADENAATIGDAIIQPGTHDGGAAPADTIATLKRFVTLNVAGNTVDGAIAEVTKSASGGLNVIDQVKDNIIPVAGPKHPAVGLLFAGSCSRTIMNPIDRVLSQLNIRFPAGPGSTVAADIGMNVEKVGRTTEYTTSTIKEIDATIQVKYDFGVATFENQIVTAWMSDGGDSGSLVYEGGEGGDEDKCICPTTSAAEEVLGVSLRQDLVMAEGIRDKYLRQTSIGRWAVDTFYLNEDRLLARIEKRKIDPKDKDYARKLYKKYIDAARKAFAEGVKSEQRLTEQHFLDIESALRRTKKYMSKEEFMAAEELLKLANKHAKGKNARAILALLNNKELFEEVRKIVSRIKSLKVSE